MRRRLPVLSFRGRSAGNPGCHSSELQKLTGRGAQCPVLAARPGCEETAAFGLRGFSCRARSAREHGAVSVMSLQENYEPSTPGLGRGFRLGRGGAPGARLWRSPGSTKVSQDRTETRIKLKVLGGLVARSGVFSRPLRNSRSWPLLAGAIRRDWSVRNSNRFCRSFHLSRNDEIASRIVARVAF